MVEPLPVLNAIEARVLGSLIEKQVTTPDYYPLTLNALTNACNQLTNREPVVSFDEQQVLRALDSLREKRLATLYRGAESRVVKFKHTLTDVILLTPAEVAVMCVLLLRGPQTPGELRSRTDRLFTFDSLPEIESTLAALAARVPHPLVARLPRQPGTKESRFAHLLSGAPESVAPAPDTTGSASPPAATTDNGDRVARLERELAAVRLELAELTRELAEFRKQFE
jgi:uncharacterized protein YceH (UPF0502 family)